MSNKFKNVRLEFHIIQSFPVSCLNRDDVGAPKSAIVGGVERARVSSQCWKRAVRMALQEFDVKIADRTRLVSAKIADKCVALGATPEQGYACGKVFSQALTGAKTQDDKKSKKAKKDNGMDSLPLQELAEPDTKTDDSSDTLFFLSDSEAEGIAKEFKEHDFKVEALGNEKQIQKICKQYVDFACDGLDIALFGRMVAKAPELNIEAASSFAHAISTHKVASEIDFFTAMDDCKGANSDTGAAHMGSLEFNSATYYRYVSLDLGQLAENLKTEDIAHSVISFAKALFVAFPAARQTTMSAANPWNYALITIRNGQRVQIPFNTPIQMNSGTDIVTASIQRLKDSFANIKRMYGKLFGLKESFEIGMESGDIDSLCESITNSIKSL